MKKLVTFILVLVMLTSFGTVAMADGSLANIAAKGEFVLGLDDTFPPMGYRDENNEIIGFDIDLAKEVSARLGFTLRLQPIEWAAKELELNSGNIDCIWNGMTATPARAESMTLSFPYVGNAQVLVVKDAAITTLADLSGKVLGLQAGSSAQDALDSSSDFKASLGSVLTFDDNLTALLDLENGNLDAVLMDVVVANYIIATSGKDFQVLEEGLAIEEYAIGFRKADVELCNAVNKALIEMALDGTLSEIAIDWFGVDSTILVESVLKAALQ